MKIKISSSPSLTGGLFWNVTITHNNIKQTTSYCEPAGAYEFARKKLKRAFKEAAAYSRLLKISTNLLNTGELSLVKKLTKSKCAGISKAQYGYLTGIYERQQRDW
jgi:hypothetical protein